MKSFTVNGLQKSSRILVGESLANAGAYLPEGIEPVIITDKNIQRLYGDAFPEGRVITIGTGEKIKTLATVETLLRELISLGCDRSGFVLGIGGGIVCDIVGFVASIFMRGIRFGFVSTSLLSQVDASVGGKNGVNLDAYKNMVGVFSQPDFVICDIDMLQTLPEAEISNGLAEIAKHGLIKDLSLLEFLEANTRKALALDTETIFRLVADSVAIKAAVVAADEREAGERRKLNFGHTIGHAIEKLEQAGHGRAVAAGMAAAVRFSEHKGYLDRKDVARVNTLLGNLNLPVQTDLPVPELIAAASRDKKKQGANLYFVFLEAIGQARVEKITYTELNTFMQTTMA
jgi:3-dehydroquinate synthase